MGLVIAGLAIVAAAAFCATGRLPRNPVVGIRIRSTMRSEASWKAGHRAAAGPLALLGFGWVLAGIQAQVGRSDSARTGQLILVFAVVFGVWGVVAAHRAASRL